MDHRLKEALNIPYVRLNNDENMVHCPKLICGGYTTEIGHKSFTHLFFQLFHINYIFHHNFCHTTAVFLILGVQLLGE